jgi:Na+/phosphate symporter
MKSGFSEIGGEISKFTRMEISPMNAFGFGWLLTLVMQSSGAATSALAVLNAENIIGTSLLVFMVLGTRIGTIITSLGVSLCVSGKRRDFRHGFEIGLLNLVYALPIAIIMFLFEYFFRSFSSVGTYFISLGPSFKFDLVGSITSPLVNFLSFLPVALLLLMGLSILLISLNRLPKTLFSLWKRDYLKKKMGKSLSSKWNSFLVGLILTAILMSTSITITLLIPLIVARVINLKKSIPYIIGAHLGGVVDIILGGLVIGRAALPAVFTYVSFSCIGLLWLINTDALFNITKHISKRTLHVSRGRAFFFVLIFVLVAFLLTFI